MISRFYNFEEASIYAARMRSEGRYAEILDGTMSSMWGPLAVGGVRVIVSDAPVEDDTPPAEGEKTAWGELFDAIRMAVVFFAAAGLVTGVVIFMRSGEPIAWFSKIVVFLPFASALVALALVPFFIRLTAVLRDAGSPVGRFLRWFVAALVILNLLYMLAVFAWALWLELK